MKDFLVKNSASVVWITGLSAAGKTTVALGVLKKIREAGTPVVFLDGDELREILCRPGQTNGHEREARLELAYRYSKLCRMISNQGITVIIATISLFHEIHEWNRKNITRYLEIYLKVPIDELRRRDPKNLYKSYDAGKIKHIAGLDLEVEEPVSPDLLINFENKNSIEDTVRLILSKL